MVFVAAVVRKFNPLTVASKWQVISATSKHFSSTTGFTPEDIEKFRKVFRTLPTYEETISSADLIQFFDAIKFNKSMESYQKHIEFTDRVFGGRVYLEQFMKYMQVQHDPILLMNEFLNTFDRNNDGYISKEEFQLGMDDVRLHDSRVPKISYEKFLKEADTNKDGKVSVSECRKWANKYLVPA